MVHVKVHFALEQDADGYPPVTTEVLWCEQLTHGSVKIDNIPFFVRDIACGDEIRIEADADGSLLYRSTIKTSGNSVFRVIPTQSVDVDYVRDALDELGCAVELYSDLRLLAVEVPETVNILPIVDFLVSSKAKNEIDFEQAALRHHLPDAALEQP